MLTSLKMENYRGFKRYQLNGLARVNLLVGRNNSGKSAVLEAVHFLASGGDPLVLLDAALRRGELIPPRPIRNDENYLLKPTLSNFFHGHEIKDGGFFRLEGNDVLRVTTTYRAERGKQLFFQFSSDDNLPLGPGLILHVEGSRFPQVEKGFPVSMDGIISDPSAQSFRRLERPDGEGNTPTNLITPDCLGNRSMHDMWGQVLIDGRESEVIETMRLLEPRLTNIFFLSAMGGYQPSSGESTGILVALEGEKRRYLLGSFGDGMRRLLALSISLVRAAGGILLVDEIETGLHYSVMGDMWRLVAQTAQQLDIQVFATTHSLDCVRGLAWLCENHPELRSEVSLQKIEPLLGEAVAFDAERIVIAVEQDLEVR